jgi:hypothetical protein
MHYSYRSIRQHLDRINTFSDIAAGEAFRAGRRPRLVSDVILNPALTFLKKYFLQKGVLDGYPGLVIAANSAYGKFLKYAKLRELARQQPPEGTPNP